MRLFLVLFWLTSANANEDVPIPDFSTDTLNKWVDFGIDSMNKVTINQGYDPVAMDDVEKSFSVSGLLFTYEASFRLTSGILNGLSTMKRTKDIVYSNNDTHIHISLPLGFDTLTVEYNYKVKVLMMKSGGNIFGKISDCSLELDLVVDMATLHITETKFHFNQLNDISVTFTGNIFDWITNKLVSVVKPILIPGINRVLQYLTSKGLDSIANGYNDGIDQVAEYSKSNKGEINDFLQKCSEMLQGLSVAN
uniref:Lipid-binding serum glycoprotein N-terminal domain-containing protein n=1 Tax=Photinus pyralis TaxID=7054 RepID=A0A1Y1MCF7_PHOPY